MNMAHIEKRTVQVEKTVTVGEKRFMLELDESEIRLVKFALVAMTLNDAVKVGSNVYDRAVSFSRELSRQGVNWSEDKDLEPLYESGDWKGSKKE